MVVNEPIHARKSVTNGFRGLLVTVRGGDGYAVVEGILVRRLPIHPGEAGWLLKVDKVVEF